MSYTAILAEKPKQGRDYAEAYTIKNKNKDYIELNSCSTFPNGAIVTWGYGHLVELQPPEVYNEAYKKWNLDHLPIIPTKFKYTVPNDKSLHFKQVKDILLNANNIIIASDIDREGELIARLIIKHCGVENKPLKRLWINTKEVDEIHKGFNNLLDANQTYNAFVEAQSRQKADWLVGMNLSPLYSLLLQKQGYTESLSIGRIQSPTVYLIYQRQKEIENFVSKPFYQIEGTFNVDDGAYQGKADIKKEKKEDAQTLLEKHHITNNTDINSYIESIDTQERHEKAPKLHSLSSLQTTANKKWKYSPKDVLAIVQHLYEKKYLSYPRTDCNYITDSEFHYIKENVYQYQTLLKVDFEPFSWEANNRFVDTKKVQEHYAIVPTRVIPSEKVLNGFSDKEKHIYYEMVSQ